MERKTRQNCREPKTHLGSCERLEDEASKIVKKCGTIAVASTEEFAALIDIALDEKLANMKDLGTQFNELQEAGKKNIHRLTMCSQLAEEIRAATAVA